MICMEELLEPGRRNYPLIGFLRRKRGGKESRTTTKIDAIRNKRTDEARIDLGRGKPSALGRGEETRKCNKKSRRGEEPQNSVQGGG